MDEGRNGQGEEGSHPGVNLEEKASAGWRARQLPGLIADFGPFSDTSEEVTVGYKWELRQKGILETGLIENIGAFDNSPDFGFHVGFSQRF